MFWLKKLLSIKKLEKLYTSIVYQLVIGAWKGVEIYRYTNEYIKHKQLL
jgi:hypothetical protein